MPLRAIRNGADVVSYEYDEVSWNKLKTSYKKETLIMPCCENKAIPKVSKLGNYFFAHARKRQCLSAPETFEHIHLKTWIAKIAASLGYDVTTEKVGETPEGERWRADVFLTKGQAKLALEIQLTSQTVSEFQRRQAKYRASGVRTLWLYKRRRRQNIPCDYDMPVFEIEAQDESGTFIVPMFDVDVNEFVVPCKGN